MPFVHSLVKIKGDKKKGWCAPAELGESAPHYVSFVIPLAEKNRLFDKYTCEAVRIDKPDVRTLVRCDMTKQGGDSFLLNVNDTQLWFFVRPSKKHEGTLHYIGKLDHPDFAYPLTEIEPEEPARLDELCEDRATFLIGCDPFTHYAGLAKLTKVRDKKT